MVSGFPHQDPRRSMTAALRTRRKCIANGQRDRVGRVGHTSVYTTDTTSLPCASLHRLLSFLHRFDLGCEADEVHPDVTLAGCDADGVATTIRLHLDPSAVLYGRWSAETASFRLPFSQTSDLG